MNKRFFGMPGFGKARLVLLACAMALALAALWPGAASATTTPGPYAVIDSVTDGGEGKIKVEWSLSTAGPNETYESEKPGKVCVYWGEMGINFDTPECVTKDEDLSAQKDIEIDTGIGKRLPSGETAHYHVVIMAYYNDMGLPPPDGVRTERVEVKSP